MIEHEIRTINEFGSRRLVIRFCNAGEPVPNHFTVLPVPQARSVQADAERNICALEINLGKEEDGDWWPVDAVLRSVRDWKMGVSDEDEAEICRLFPHQWRRTGDSMVDAPIPAHVRCDNCAEHQGTLFWAGEHKPDYHMPFAYQAIWCECCCTRAQLKWAEKEAARIAGSIPGLRAKLAAGCGPDTPRLPPPRSLLVAAGSLPHGPDAALRHSRPGSRPRVPLLVADRLPRAAPRLRGPLPGQQGVVLPLA